MNGISAGVDLTPLFSQIIVPVLGSLLLALAPVALNWAARHFKGLANAQVANGLLTAAQTAIAYGASKAEAKLVPGAITIKSQNQIVQQAAGYLSTTMPVALKQFGYDDPAKLSTFLEGQLARLLHIEGTAASTPAGGAAQPIAGLTVAQPETAKAA